MTDQKTTCLLCQNQNARQQLGGMHDKYWFWCPTCGNYAISGTLVAVIRGGGGDYKQNAHIASGLVRELMETHAKAPEFTTTNFQELISRYPVPDVTDVRAKAEKLLIRIREKTSHFGQSVELWHTRDYPLAYAQNVKEFEALLGVLEEDGLIQMTEKRMGVGGRTDAVTVRPAGWSLVRSLQGTNSKSEQGFVAIWFDDVMNESITAIEQAITDAGFKALCIRGEHFKDKIMDKALSEIRKSQFIVIDLTGARNSVFFEAGFAFGLGIEAIYVYKQDAAEGLEFYVRHYQCYSYTDADDLREKLKAAIGARMKK